MLNSGCCRDLNIKNTSSSSCEKGMSVFFPLFPKEFIMKSYVNIYFYA